MKTLEELEELTDIVSMGADYSAEDNELLLYISSPEISLSLHFEGNEWDQFVERIQSIDQKVGK